MVSPQQINTLAQIQSHNVNSIYLLGISSVELDQYNGLVSVISGPSEATMTITAYLPSGRVTGNSAHAACKDLGLELVHINSQARQAEVYNIAHNLNR